jgi:anti-sigma factor RsiW
MTRIIRLHGDDHHQAQTLLPWYVTGSLEASEQQQVEAHLSVCPQCQADLQSERRLDAEVAALTIEVEHGWTRLQGRLDLNPRRRGALAAPGEWLTAIHRDATRKWRGATSWLGWALVMQALVLAVVGMVLLRPAQPARYHVLATAPAPATGNLVVIFRPDTRESDLRSTLRGARARLVDGPTAADAYVLEVPAADRSAALARLRAQASIVLAEPIDAGERP